MFIKFLKDFNGHVKDELFETNGSMGRYLIDQGIAVMSDTKIEMSTDNGETWKEVICDPNFGKADTTKLN